MKAFLWRVLALTAVLPLLSACAGSPTGDVSSIALLSSKAGGASAQESADGSSAVVTSDASSAASLADSSSETATSEASSTPATSATSSKASSATSSKASSATSSKASSATSSQTPVNKFALPFRKGMNINGLENGTNSSYLSSDSTYTDLRNKGFDHVRLPVPLSRYYNASTGTLRTSGANSITSIDNYVTKAINAGLYVILDFHDHSFNNTGAVFAANNADQRALFLKIWEQLAIHYKDYSDKLVFELINEPALNTSSASNLNMVQNAAIAKIRETNPDRIILATITDASQPWLLTNNGGASSLKLTAGTTRVGLVIHCYNPGTFTHQNVSWSKPANQPIARLTDSDRGTLRWDLNQVKAFMNANPDIPVTINEFGVCHRGTNTDDITEYLTIVREWCESNNVPWAYWQYAGNEMGARSSASGSWYDYVLAGLGLK